MILKETTGNTARLLKKRFLSDTVVVHTFHHPHIARRGKPGQFVQILTSSGIEPYFRRPMSIFATDPEKETFSVLYAIVGPGTRHLAGTAIGEKLSIIGPLGNTFSIPRRCRHAVLVAGGVGLPPLDFWARHLRAAKKKKLLQVTMLVGARSDAERICTPHIKSVRRLWSTDDGSFDLRGTVIDLLRKVHSEENWPREETAIYGCGPAPMLKALQKWMLSHGYRGQLSLEELMLCGFGVCSGCVVEARPAKQGYDRFRRVCYDGPVFDAREVSL